MSPRSIWPLIDAEIQSNEVKVWLFNKPTTIDRETLAICRSLLSATENAYAEKKSVKTQQHYIVKQALLRHVLGHYHANHSASSLCFTYNQYGKPSVSCPDTPLQFNMSHSDNWYAIAVCLEREIGVDIEVIKPGRKIQQIAEHFFHPKEIHYLALNKGLKYTEYFYKLWTLKEAIVKAMGVGMSLPFNQFSVVKDSTDTIPPSGLFKSLSLRNKTWDLQHIWLNESVSLALSVEEVPENAVDVTINTLTLDSCNI